MLSVEALVESHSLRMRVMAGRGGLNREIRSAHSTEHVDPTPWLHGGELLMTTGMRMKVRPDWQAYVDRLKRRGVAALALGVGIDMTFRRTPPALCAAADAQDLPVLEVPTETPFIAITEAVFSAMRAKREEALLRAQAAQRQLTEAAVRGAGPLQLVEALAKTVDGWALIADLRGLVIATSPTCPDRTASRYQAEFARLRKSGLRSSASVALAAHERAAIILPLGARSLRGFLVVAGGAGQVDEFYRNCASAAASLLTLNLEAERSVVMAERRIREKEMYLLLEATDEQTVARSLRGLGLLADEYDTYAVSTAHPDLVVDMFYDLFPRSVVIQLDDMVIALLARPHGDVLGELRRLEVVDHVGTGSTTAVAWIPRVIRQTQQALRTAVERCLAYVDANAMDQINFLLRVASDDVLEAYADAVLAPLEHGGARSDLVNTLFGFLEADGALEVAARRLHIHRNTMRNRLERIQQVSGRDLTAVSDLCELWTAYQIRNIMAKA